MDGFIDPFLSPSSWSDLNTSSKSSWASDIVSQANSLLADSIEAYPGDENNSPMGMIPSSHTTGNVATEGLDLHAHSDNTAGFTNGNTNYFSQIELSSHNSHPSQHDRDIQESSFRLKDVFESNSTSESYGQELNTSCSVTLPHSALTISSSIESNGSEPSKFAQSLGDTHSISSVPSLWPPSYSGVSSFTERGKLEDFEFQGDESGPDVLGRADIENDKYPLLNNSAPASLQDCNELYSNLSNFDLLQQMKLAIGKLHPHNQETTEFHNHHFQSFSPGPQMTLAKPSGIQARQQLSQSTEENVLKHQMNHSSGVQQPTLANASACNGATKPRIRARRGQATDPHSIAERLRREKIAERMKNLQELVPNSNKTDKASMLDEIIDYVKFLQLQVKVLSMSRLGAAGAVVPLITDSQSEGLRALHLSSVSQGGADLSEDVQDEQAFEKEVVKLLESNVTTAMQYLQNKGLCLMPIALASAISSQKGSNCAAIPPEKRKPSNAQILAERINGEMNGGHNVSNGSVLKQEEAHDSI